MKSEFGDSTFIENNEKTYEHNNKRDPHGVFCENCYATGMGFFGKDFFFLIFFSF